MVNVKTKKKGSYMNLYDWKESYSQGSLGTDTFIKGILKFLRNGERYYYIVKGNKKLGGHINSFDGPLGWVQIISSAQWAYEDTKGPIEIRAIYLGDIAFYATFINKPDSRFNIAENERGHWTNMVCNYARTGDPTKR